MCVVAIVMAMFSSAGAMSGGAETEIPTYSGAG